MTILSDWVAVLTAQTYPTTELFIHTPNGFDPLGVLCEMFRTSTYSMQTGGQSATPPMFLGAPQLNFTTEGDSISEGATRWPYFLFPSGNPKNRFTSHAVSGSPTADMVARYETYKTALGTHFACLGGVNDLASDVDIPPTFWANRAANRRRSSWVRLIITAASISPAS